MTYDYKPSMIPKWYMAKAEPYLNQHDVFPTSDFFLCTMQSLFWAEQDGAYYNYFSGGVTAPKVGVGYGEVTIEGVHWAYWCRPVIKIKIPKPPHDGMVPLSVKLLLPAWNGTLNESAGATDGNIENILDTKVKAVKCNVVPKFAYNDGYLLRDSDGEYRYDHGCTWRFKDGVNAWGWHPTSGTPPLPVFGKAKPTPSDIGETLGEVITMDISDPGPPERTGIYLRFPLNTMLFMNDIESETDLYLMLLDTYEDEPPNHDFDWRLVSVFTPFNESEEPSGSMNYPTAAEAGTEIDCVIDGATEGIAKPLLYIEWGFAEADNNLPQPTELKIEPAEEHYGRVKVSWKAPDKPSGFWLFRKYMIYVTDDRTAAPATALHSEIFDYDNTEVEIEKGDSDFLSIRVAAIWGSENTTLDDDYTFGIGAQGQVTFPQSQGIQKILRASDEEEEDFQVGDALSLGAAGYICDAVGYNTNSIAVEDDEIIVEDGAGINPIHPPALGSMVIIGPSPASYPDDLERWVMRKVIGIDYLLFADRFTLDAPVGLAFGVNEAVILRVISCPDLRILPGLDARIDITDFSRSAATLEPLDTAMPCKEFESFEVDDVICIMDGFTPRFAKITGFDGTSLEIEKLGEWAPDGEALSISDGVWFFKTPLFVFHRKGSYSPDLLMTDTSDKKLVDYRQGIKTVTVLGATPIPKIVPDRLVYENGETSRFFGFATAFLGSDEELGSGPKLYYYFGYDSHNPPLAPVPGGALNGWIESDSPYEDHTFNSSLGIVSIVNNAGLIEVELDDVHEIDVGAFVRISGTENYDGDHSVVAWISSTKVKLTAAYVSDEVVGSMLVTLASRCVAMRAWTGEPVATNPDALSDPTETTVRTSETVFQDYETVLDLDVVLQNKYQIEDTNGGREIDASKSRDDSAQIDSDVSKVTEISISGRCWVHHSTHPDPVIDAWRIARGIDNVLPDDLLTLKFIEENRLCVKMAHEGRTIVGVMGDIGRSREAGYGTARDWRATIYVIGWE